jgi:hypothetical protein
MPSDVQINSMTALSEAFPNDSRLRETYHGLHNASHRWVYFPNVEPTECLLLKTFESCVEAGMAQFALHGAFPLPNQQEEPGRESVEIRCLVFDGDLEEGFGDGFVPPAGQSGQQGGDPIIHQEWITCRPNEWVVGD